MLNRETLIARLKDNATVWDVIVIGGGATGLGAALDASSRGYQTLLIERNDFGGGTSSRSTKLAHGGVRYLKQRDFSMVKEALRERGLMFRNAPHLLHRRSFVIPVFSRFEKLYYSAGLKLYDFLAGSRNIGSSRGLGLAATVDALPTIRTSDLHGGVEYFDGQFDDTRLAITLAQSVADAGGIPINYASAVRLVRENERVAGVVVRDGLSQDEYHVRGKVVINAAGVFSDGVRRMDDSDATSAVTYSQGAHLVLDRKVLPGKSALMIPSTKDGRVVFAIPWHDRVLVGTTDVPVNDAPIEPRPLNEEVDFLLTHLSEFLEDPITGDAVKSVFAGIRPLVSNGDSSKTSDISRSHAVSVSKTGLVSITGGKWTTYRQMAEDTIDTAAEIGDLEARPCITQGLRLHGWTELTNADDVVGTYGIDAKLIEALEDESPDLKALVHPNLPYKLSAVVWAVRNEMALTLEDVLARRTRSLLLDAEASVEAAPAVSDLMARMLGKPQSWADDQVAEYKRLAKNYVV